MLVPSFRKQQQQQQQQDEHKSSSANRRRSAPYKRRGQVDTFGKKRFPCTKCDCAFVKEDSLL